MLFVPAHKDELIAKALSSSADAVIFDLEDSCPGMGNYHKGRENIKDNPGHFVRVRSYKDFDISCYCRGVIVPKAESVIPKDVFVCDVYALIETAAGVINCDQIAGSVKGLVFGNEDYSSDTMCEDYSFARGMIVNCARKHNITAIDTVNVDVHNLEKLEGDCFASASAGFDGKLCIHPKEIEVIHRYYTPTKEQYLYSLKVVRLYDKAVQQGSGVAILDGVYVAPPMVKKANKIITRYETYND